MSELRPTLQPDPPATPDPAAASLQEDALAKGEGGGSPNAPPAATPIHSGTENFALKRFCVRESDLAKRLGLARRDLTALRSEQLSEGVDFLKNGRLVLYCEAGAARLAAALTGGRLSEKMLPAAGLCTPASARAVSSFTVRRKATNTHVLECEDEAGHRVLVRVRTSANFLPGMPLTAVPYGDLHNVYEFAGAYPRFRGKY